MTFKPERIPNELLLCIFLFFYAVGWAFAPLLLSCLYP